MFRRGKHRTIKLKLPTALSVMMLTGLAVEVCSGCDENRQPPAAKPAAAKPSRARPPAAAAGERPDDRRAMVTTQIESSATSNDISSPARDSSPNTSMEHRSDNWAPWRLSLDATRSDSAPPRPKIAFRPEAPPVADTSNGWPPQLPSGPKTTNSHLCRPSRSQTVSRSACLRAKTTVPPPCTKWRSTPAGRRRIPGTKIPDFAGIPVVSRAVAIVLPSLPRVDAPIPK